MLVASFIHEDVLIEVSKADQNLGESPHSISSSIEKFPQTPIYDSNHAFQRKDIQDVMPKEEDLVEAQITWDLGKIMGLQESNENTMIDALSKVQEVQDFVLPRRRGRPRKNTSRSKE